MTSPYLVLLMIVACLCFGCVILILVRELIEKRIIEFMKRVIDCENELNDLHQTMRDFIKKDQEVNLACAEFKQHADNENIYEINAII